MCPFSPSPTSGPRARTFPPIHQCHYEKLVVAETAALARDVTYNHALGRLIEASVAVDGTKCMRSGPGKVGPGGAIAQSNIDNKVDPGVSEATRSECTGQSRGAGFHWLDWGVQGAAVVKAARGLRAADALPRCISLWYAYACGMHKLMVCTTVVAA